MSIFSKEDSLWCLPLFYHFKAIYQFPKHVIFLVKIVANASLNDQNEVVYYT